MGLAQQVNFLCSDLLQKVSRSREAELEASGRASGLQIAVEVLRGENASLRQTNEMLINRAFAGSHVGTPTLGYQGPMVGGGGALPTIVGGVPAGSPRPSHFAPPLENFAPALPVVGAAPTREPVNYGTGGMNEIDPFGDMGDREAEKRGIRLDETTGALEGGPMVPSLPRM